KFLGSIFLRALGLKTDEQILRAFYKGEILRLQDKKVLLEVSEGMIGTKLSHHVLHPKTKEEIVHGGRKITHSQYEAMQKAHINALEVTAHDLDGARLLADAVDTKTGEVIAEANKEITAELLNRLQESGIAQVHIFFPEREDTGIVLAQTLQKDSLKSQEEA